MLGKRKKIYAVIVTVIVVTIMMTIKTVVPSPAVG